MTWRLLALLTPLAAVYLVAVGLAPPTAPAPAAPPEHDPIALARSAVQRLDAADGHISSLVLASALGNRAGSTHVRFKRYVNRLEVVGGDASAVVDAGGRVVVAAGSLDGDSAPATPALDAVNATRLATRALALPPVGSIASRHGGPQRATTFEAATYIRPPRAALVMFPAQGNQHRITWRIELPASFTDWWDVFVDARSGDVVYAANRAQGDGPIGEAFFDDPDDGTPTPVEFGGTLPAPRHAWSAGGLTSGNNVIAGLDRDADLEPAPVAVQPYGFADAYRASNGADAATDSDAAIANVFYWMNRAHDRFYELGFDEGAGNYQAENFGANGLGGDPVIALIQWAAEHCDFNPFIICGNDAMFIAQEDGEPGFAAFTLMSPPLPYVDGAFASDVVVHEYTHGVTQRIIGVSMLGGPHGFALSEGWSDWFAASITGDPVFAEYWNGNLARGMRQHSMADSPLTYADFCNLHAQGCEGHADGEIWAAALWDIRQALIARYGVDAGVRRAEELVLEGMILTPPLPSLVEARDGIIETELARGGPDHCTLWTLFAARGLGQSAAGEGFPENTAAAAFDVPARCTGASSVDGDGMPDAYELAHACLSPTAGDGTGDPDSDGLTNIREWIIGTVPCDSDTDGDYCGDLIETEPNPEFGGARDPLDLWDFFDVTGDRFINLNDALDVLAYYGAPPGAGESALRDRYIPDATRPWRTAHAHDGVDLIDALVVLKSFGHSCAG